MESYQRSLNDIVSNLPTNVKETILTYLPIRDAVSTVVGCGKCLEAASNYFNQPQISQVNFNMFWATGQAIICSLIKGSPKLQNIEIEMFSVATVPSSVLEFLEEQGYLDLSLDHLQLVMIHHLSCMQPELEFIKLLLAKSPMLEKLLIKYYLKKITDKRLWMLKNLIHFERASPKAQMIFEGPLPS